MKVRARPAADGFHFRVEKEVVEEAIERRPQHPKTGPIVDQLIQVNERMWAGVEFVENASREYPQTLPKKVALAVAQVAVDLQRWNRERYALIHEIDRLTGEYVGQEKV
jgi:hypothetical protein